MEAQVSPLAMMQVDWTTYIKMCQDVLGYSPTRGLDECAIDPKSPAAYLATLDLENQPLEHLRNPEDSQGFHHVFFSFIVELISPEDIMAIKGGRLRVLNKRGSSTYLAILSGSILDWYYQTIFGCTKKSSIGVRQVMNKCYEYLCLAGFKEVWSNYERIDLQDQTFYLRRC